VEQQSFYELVDWQTATRTAVSDGRVPKHAFYAALARTPSYIVSYGPQLQQWMLTYINSKHGFPCQWNVTIPTSFSARPPIGNSHLSRSATTLVLSHLSTIFMVREVALLAPTECESIASDL